MVMKPRIGMTGIILLFSLFIMLWEAEKAQCAQASYITGRIESASSRKPLPSLWVVVYDGRTLKGRSLTGDDGKYYIGGLEYKGYKIVVRRGSKELFEEVIRLPQHEHHDIRVRE
jgi:hypothetical protein